MKEHFQNNTRTKIRRNSNEMSSSTTTIHRIMKTNHLFLHHEWNFTISSTKIIFHIQFYGQVRQLSRGFEQRNSLIHIHAFSEIVKPQGNEA